MQSTGQTSRHDSQPVQLSALIIATSFGSFLRGPALAISKVLVGQLVRVEIQDRRPCVIFFTKPNRIIRAALPDANRFGVGINRLVTRAREMHSDSLLQRQRIEFLTEDTGMRSSLVMAVVIVGVIALGCSKQGSGRIGAAGTSG